MCNIGIIIRKGARVMRLGFKGDAARSAERNARHSKMRLYYINIIIILYIYYSIHTMQIFYLSVKWYIYYI